jgi:hypothetical protein
MGKGSKEVGHVAKILNNLSKPPIAIKNIQENNDMKKAIPINPLENSNAFCNIIAKPPILVYDSQKVNKQFQENYILKKYLPLYEQHQLLIPFVVEKFPTHGISGSFVMPPFEQQDLKENNVYANNAYGYCWTRYTLIMYGGEPIKTIDDIRFRQRQLFTKADDILNYSYPEKHIQGIPSIFPKMQHILSQDTYGLGYHRDSLTYPSNFNVSTKRITLQKDTELYVLEKTHPFVKGEIIIIDSNNLNHQSLLEKYKNIFNHVCKQVEPDSIGSDTVIATNEKVFFPIDIKIITHPEKNLDMLSSHCSISSNYNSVETANKMYGQLHNCNIKDSFIQHNLKLLYKEYHKVKVKKITEDTFREVYGKWTTEFFQKQIQSGKFIYDKFSTLPSIITDADQPSNNYYEHLKKTNPSKIEYMIKDAYESLNYNKHFPIGRDFRYYDVYSTQLSYMIFVKKQGFIDNYYAVRKLLLINDVHHDL